MSIFEDFDFAYKKTKEVHPEFDERETSLVLATSNYDLKGFTRTDGARDGVKKYSQDDYIAMLAKMAIRIGLTYGLCETKYPNALDQFPMGRECKDFCEAVYNKKVDAFAYLRANPDFLTEIAKAFSDYRYKNGGKLLSCMPKINASKGDALIEESKNKIASVSNYYVRKPAYNKCLEEVRNGSQVTLKRSEYALDGELFAVSDVGKKRTNQEDSVLIMTHPKNPDFKILVVCDGMGGLSKGEFASSYATSKISEWFESLDPGMYENEEMVRTSYVAKIEEISKEINNKEKNCGCTLTSAIVGKEYTVITNVGDSRTYAVQDGKLVQLTRDDSLVQYLYERRDIETKDDMRFHKESNKIYRSIGDEQVQVSSGTIPNSSYESLLLFSDGVTDCLDDKDIRVIATTTPKEEVARSIVDAAKNGKSVRFYTSDDYFTEIPGGKDNTTAAAYIKGR